MDAQIRNEVLGPEGIVITSLVKAKARFDEAFESMSDEVRRDGAIQRFEFTMELSWKI